MRLSTILTLALLTTNLLVAQDGRFVNPHRLDELSEPGSCDGPSHISADGLEFYLNTTRRAGECSDVGQFDMYVATREDLDAPWGQPLPLEILNSPGGDYWPRVSSDGSRLFFASRRFDPEGPFWVAERLNPGERPPVFDAPYPLSQPINGNSASGSLGLSCDDRFLYFTRQEGSLVPYVVEIDSEGEAVDDPVRLDGANLTTDETSLFPACDGRALFFDDYLAPLLNRSRVYLAIRGEDGAFDAPIALPAPVNDRGWNNNAVVSRDWPGSGSKIWWSSNRGGGWDIWEATWRPHNPCPPPPVVRRICRDPGGDSVRVTLGVGVPGEFPGCDALGAFTIRETLPTGWDLLSSEPPATGLGRNLSWALEGEAGAPGTMVSYTLAPREAGGETATWTGISHRPEGDPLPVSGDEELDLTDPSAGLCSDLPTFERADSNTDGNVDVSDGIFTLDWLFLGGVEGLCHDAADANDDGEVGLSDAVLTFQFLFSGGTAPRRPFSLGAQACGADPSDDLLGCEHYAPCE